MDDKKKDFKLIKTPDPLKGVNNFWRVCPRVLEYLPESACAQGTPVIDSKNGKIKEEPKCEWWINSPEHFFCFWRYLRDRSGPDGVMQELVQSELAHLFGWSNTKTHFMLKQAMEELTDALKRYHANELLESLDSGEFQEIISNIDSDKFDYE